MSSLLAINLEDLLHQRGVESVRLELKESWDEKTTGPQIIQTICAFANDFQNLNGGYVVLGVAEKNGRAVLPPAGLSTDQLAAAQKWIRGHCNQIDPVYHPILAPEIYQEKQILVIWAPGSQSRPHQAPPNEKSGERQYFIRLGNETVNVDKKPELRQQLLHMTARVPFDDRRNLQASVNDIRETKVREFLHDIRSGLQEESDSKSLYRKLGIAEPVNGHDAPRNIGLLFFSQSPEQWFRGAKIEVVQYAADADGNVLEERSFGNMPIHEQLQAALAYLGNLLQTQTRKLPTGMHADKWISFPELALREALVNAVYHRSYESDVVEPCKVYLYGDRIEIISYPGPVPGIELAHLEGNKPLPPVPARNKRIGEFLKELRLAEQRGTGVAKLHGEMRKNGSPPPRFDFDEARSYFRVTLPAHPEYQAILALRDVTYLKSTGDAFKAQQRLQQAFAKLPASLILARELMQAWLTQSDLHSATAIFRQFTASNPQANPASLLVLLARACLDEGRDKEAIAWLNQLPILDTVEEAVEAAIQEKRAQRYQQAHKYFQLGGPALYQDVKALHEFAQVKMKLAGQNRGQKHAYQRLLREAQEMLQKVVQMQAPAPRLAWAWHDLGQVLSWQKAPHTQILEAYQQAVNYLPEEERFQQSLQAARDKA